MHQANRKLVNLQQTDQLKNILKLNKESKDKLLAAVRKINKLFLEGKVIVVLKKGTKLVIVRAKNQYQIRLQNNLHLNQSVNNHRLKVLKDQVTVNQTKRL